MRIGIISMQRVKNYGSLLQAYALKTILEQWGNEVSFVDIERKPSHTDHREGKVEWVAKRLKKIDCYFFRRLSDRKKNKTLDKLFLKYQKEYLQLSESVMKEKQYDVIVIGSDEIFNASSTSDWGITQQRFGMVPYALKTISYAASCGNTSLRDTSEEDRMLIREALLNMQSISVRDENTANFVLELTGKRPTLNLDPVLIYDFKSELEEGEDEGYPSYPYMIVYAYHNRIDSKEEIIAIKNYAAEHNLRTIAIGGALPWCDEFAVISPFQVLAYFKHSTCVVTDTFHGTVLASKYNRPLAVFVRKSNANKLDDLLCRLKISDHKILDVDKLERILDSGCDYSELNETLTSGKCEAITYLRNAVEDNEKN